MNHIYTNKITLLDYVRSYSILRKRATLILKVIPLILPSPI